MTGSRTTLVGTPVVAAPGKIFLVGEYAVLEGGVAVLAAVSRYAVAQYLPGSEPQSAVVDEAVKRALAAIGEASALPPGPCWWTQTRSAKAKSRLGWALARRPLWQRWAPCSRLLVCPSKACNMRSSRSPRLPTARPRTEWARAPTWQPRSGVASPSSCGPPKVPCRRTDCCAGRPAPGCVLDRRVG